MSGVYDDLIDVAVELIDEFGRDGIIRKVSGLPVSDVSKPWKGSNSSEVVAEEDIRVVILDGDALNSSYVKQYFEGEYTSQDTFLYVAAKNLTTKIDTKDVIVVGDLSFNVLRFKLISPSGEDILYIVQGRV